MSKQSETMTPEEWSRYFERCLKLFKVGDIYLDGYYHPTICLRVHVEHERQDIGLEGISLFDGSWPRGCSVVHSAPDKISSEEAWTMKAAYEASKRPKQGHVETVMRYSDGQAVMNDDMVTLEGDDGEVVCVLEREKIPSAFAKDIWEGYTRRAVIKFSKRGFAHYFGELETGIKLAARKSAA